MHFSHLQHLQEKAQNDMSTTRDSGLNKDGKPKKARKGSGPSVKYAGPGFARGKLSLQADRTWLVDGTCINGNATRNFTTKLPAGVRYYGGGVITSPADAALYLADSVTVDPNFIFPWDPTSDDPMRAGGGIVSGIIIEGAQRIDGGPGIPIMAPFLATEWVNGAPFRIMVEVPAALGVTFYPGDSAFALVIVDAVSGQTIMRAVAKSEGSCLDLPVT
jgi:hypothetical protein